MTAVLLAPLLCRADGPERTTAPSVSTAARAGGGGVVVDGIAAIVNRDAITRSEVEDAAWFARFSSSLNGKTNLAPLTATEYQQALDHLIDQDLLSQAQQKAGYDEVPADAVHRQIDTMAQLAGGMTALGERLATFHLQFSSIQTLVRKQLNILNFLDERLRPSIVIGEEQIEQYYQKEFVPAARARGLQPASLDQVREDIRRILLEQEMARQQQQWLQQLRASAQIEKRASSLFPMG